MANVSDPFVANIVTVGPFEPYPTGTPYVTDLTKCHSPQELQTAANWDAQRTLNLAAGGMVSGGAKAP